jgi:uncharacterized protein YcnI
MPTTPIARRRAARLAGGAVAALGLLVGLAGPAAAHIGTEATSTAAGSTSIVRFKIGHGCDGSPTTEVRIQIPDGVTSVRPEATPGWEVEVARQGEEVREVTWSGGSLPDEQFLQLGLSVRWPEAPGETVWFPTVQTCEEGEHAWVQIPEEGQPEPDEPAPGVELTEAVEGDGHGGGMADGDVADAGEVAAGEGAAGTSSDDDGTDAVAVVALVVGALGVVLGGAGLVLARRSRP